MSSIYNEYKKKEKVLREQYGGGMLTWKNLLQELNRSENTVRRWVAETGLEGVRIGGTVLYEADQVAKAIVNARGMT